jgi:hypothetical protein
MSRDATPSAHAHELLHLFGADDYYHAAYSMLLIGKEEFLHRSIMFNGGRLAIEELSISETTAENIGWR